MFLRNDAERLANAVHGDWKAAAEDRKRAAEERKAKIISNKRAHIMSGDCVGRDGCLYCIDERRRMRDQGIGDDIAVNEESGALIPKRKKVAYVEIPDDDEDREVWITGMRRTAAEDPTWGA